MHLGLAVGGDAAGGDGLFLFRLQAVGHGGHGALGLGQAGTEAVQVVQQLFPAPGHGFGSVALLLQGLLLVFQIGHLGAQAGVLVLQGGKGRF